MYVSGKNKYMTDIMYMMDVENNEFWPEFSKMSEITIMTSCFRQWFRTFLLACFAKIFGKIFRLSTGVPSKLPYQKQKEFLQFLEFLKFLDVHFCKSFGKLPKLSKLLTERSTLLFTTKYLTKIFTNKFFLEVNYNTYRGGVQAL